MKLLLLSLFFLGNLMFNSHKKASVPLIIKLRVTIVP